MNYMLKIELAKQIKETEINLKKLKRLYGTNKKLQSNNCTSKRS